MSGGGICHYCQRYVCECPDTLAEQLQQAADRSHAVANHNYHVAGDLSAQVVALREELHQLKASIADKMVDAHGTGQLSAIDDVNAGRVDDLIAPRLEKLAVWKEAIIDAAVVGWTYRAEHEDDPRAAVHALLVQAQLEALDPAISKSAADLVAKTRKAALLEAAEIAKDERCSVSDCLDCLPAEEIERVIRQLAEATK